MTLSEIKKRIIRIAGSFKSTDPYWFKEWRFELMKNEVSYWCDGLYEKITNSQKNALHDWLAVQERKV